MKRTVLILMLVTTLLLASCVQSIVTIPDVCKAELGCAQFSTGQTIKIGYAGPMTGDYSQFGVDMSNAMKLAVSDLGDVKGWKVAMVIEDDGASEGDSTVVANKLIADSTFVAMAGHALSGATAAAMPIYEKTSIPMMSPSATDPDLTARGSKVFNRNAFTNTDQGIYSASFLFKTLKIKKLAILHDGSTYGQGLANVVKDNFIKLGGEVVAFEAITPGESDYNIPLAAVASPKPEALYFAGYNTEGAALINQMKQAGLTDIVFFGSDGVYGKDFLAKTGASAEGAYAATMIPPETGTVLKFNKAYKTAYGTEAGVLSTYTWNSYDAVGALIKAINSVAIVKGDKLYIPRGALAAAVRSTKDYQGLAGVITCKNDGECNASGPAFYVVKNGAWVPAK